MLFKIIDTIKLIERKVISLKASKREIDTRINLIDESDCTLTRVQLIRDNLSDSTQVSNKWWAKYFSSL
jgi:hypothetical protein